MTLVRGPNEAGKSTLQRALELVLTRPATSTAADLESLRTWGSSPTEAPAVAIAFTWEDEEGDEHAGKLAKVFSGSSGTTSLELDGQPVSDPAHADETLAALSGLPSEGFLRSTASVRQADLDGLQRDETVLRERLTATLSGADRSTARARRQLEAALEELAPRDGSAGRVAIAAEAVADAERRLVAADEGLARLVQDRQSHTGSKERRADAESALAERRIQLETARTAERLRAELDAAQTRRDKYAQAIAIRDELAELEQTHPSPQPLAELRPAVERLRILDGRIASLQELLADEVRVDFDLAPARRWQPRSRVGIALALVGVLVAVVGVALSLAGLVNLGVLPGIVGIVIAAIGGAVALSGLRERRADQAAALHMREEEVHRRLRGRSDLEVELKRDQAERETTLAGLELAATAEAEERLTAETAHVAKIEEGQAILLGLIGDEHQDTLPSKRDAAAAEIGRATEALEALGPIAKEPRARERLEVEVRDAEGVADRARDDEAVVRARVEQNAVDSEEAAGLAERLAMWRSDLEALRRRERILTRTLAELDAAERGTMARASRFLERQMVADVARVTGGHYTQVRMDDAGLAFEVRSPERGDWVPVSSLSRGTLDAVYLAARLGLVRLVTGDRHPPLLLDDPVVSLDDERAAQALAVLRELAKDFQMVFLTSSSRYDELADAVIVLDGPGKVANS